MNSYSHSSVNSIKSFDFSTLYTTIPYSKLKSKLRDIIYQCFLHKNENPRFKHVALGYADICFVPDHSDAPQTYSDANVVKMLACLNDNIFGGRIFQQTIDIPIGTNCASLLYTRMR